MVLFLVLLIDVSFASDGVSRATITKRNNLPTFQATATASQHSSKSHSSYHVTFSPVVPSASENKYVYHKSQKDGTVFIAVGSCIGFLILATIGIWLFFTIRAWSSARKEYRLKEMENKYQYDPFFFAEPYDNSTDFSDTDDRSDISEKVLKTKASRVSMYSLGSNSALNLLNQGQPPQASNAVVDPNAALVNASNMFISPTEILKTQGNNRSTFNPAQPPQSGSDNSNPNSGESTPREQAFAQIIGHPSIHSLPPMMRNNYMNNTRSSLASISPYANLPDVNAPSSDNPPPRRTRGKDYRPPSVHLDTLLNQDL